VDEVRTSDDALIKIKLMVFYELKDIMKMVWIVDIRFFFQWYKFIVIWLWIF
jgi:hypothetical protein